MRTRVLTYSQSYSSMCALSRIRYDPFGLISAWTFFERLIKQSSEPLTVHQCPLNFLLVRHDERTVLENSLIERLPSDLSQKKNQEWSSMKTVYIPKQTKYRWLQLLVAHQSRRSR